MGKVPIWRCPSSAPAPPRGVRAWRLWTARHTDAQAGPLGAQPLPWVLEPAASKAADFTAFEHAGMTADLSSMEAAYKGKYGYELRVTQTFEQVCVVVGALMHWCIGALGHWGIGALGHWRIGA